MLRDIKLSKAPISNFGNNKKKSTKKRYYSFSQRTFIWISKQVPSSAINKFVRKTSGKGAVRAGKGFTVFISNKDMNDAIKIIKSLEDSNVLIDDITETVKHEKEQQELGFLSELLGSLAASLVEPVISLVVKGINGKGV